MKEFFNWAILGPGGISKKFAQALQFVPRARIAAVGSRDLSRARAFASEFNIARAYGSYSDLLKDDQVDIVYIATPHNVHFENTIAALESGRCVLCEKPFAVSASQAAEMIKLASLKKLFCMEAMWSRFIPLLGETRRLLAENTIGEVKLLAADFGFKADAALHPRIVDPALAGGALLDVGVYAIALASMVLGSPKKLQASMVFGSTGVDEIDSIILSYDNNRIAQLACSCILPTPLEATVIGTAGFIRLHSPWYRGNRMSLKLQDQPEKLFEFASHENGFVYEIEHVHSCLDQGLAQSPVMPLNDTLEIAKIMDTARNLCGLKFPFEKDLPRSYFE